MLVKLIIVGLLSLALSGAYWLFESFQGTIRKEEALGKTAITTVCVMLLVLIIHIICGTG